MLTGSIYTGESDIATKATAYFENRNFMDCLNGETKPTFIQRWGGEILYDNFKVIVNERIGEDSGTEVRYGKNMEHINYHVDMSEICTRIIPIAYNGRKCTGIFVDSPNINKYVKKYRRKIKFEEVRFIDDIGEGEDTTDYIVCNTQEELDAALLKKCNEQFELGIDLPKVTITVDMIMLSKTEEYKDFSEIEKIGLGDTVSCYNRDLDISTKARAIELVWDCIEDCAKNVVLGDYQYDYFSQVNSTIQRIEGAIRPNGTIIAEKVKGFLNAMETSLRLQSSAAKKVDGRAFLIEDTDETSELYGAMEAGTQGLRISNEKDAENNWIWKTAMTAAGIIADTIVAGLLTDKSGNNFWDLDQGVLEATNLAVQESIATQVLHCEEIQNAAYPKTLTSNLTLYVNADSGDDDQKCVDGTVFQTLQGAINSIPKFMNTRYVYIELQTDVTENIDVRGFTGGFIWVYLAGHTIYGRVNNYTVYHVRYYGGTKDGGGTDLTGTIHPSCADQVGTIVANGCYNVYLSNLIIYGADTLASGLDGTAKTALYTQGATYVHSDNIEIVNVARGFVATGGSHVHINRSSGMASQHAFVGTHGGVISLSNNAQGGGVTANAAEYHGGKVRYMTPTFETGDASGSDAVASTAKVAKNVTYTSSKGNAIQNYGGSSAKWRSDNTPKVGTWGYGNHVAFWFFGDQFENVANKDVTKIEITFTRNSGGYGSAVQHNFYAHDYKSQPGTVAPSYYGTKIGSASVATGKSAIITITDAKLIAAIIARKGICSVPPSQSKAYYSVMSGTMKVKFYYTE